MKEDVAIPELTFFGGPLQRLGGRLGLVRGSNTFWLGVALGLLAWGVLVLLAIVQGAGHKVFSMTMIGAHIRFLVAIPLFFLCETWVGPRMAEFVRDIVRFGVVPESERPELAAVVGRVDRMTDPWSAELVFLLAAIGLALVAPLLNLPGRTGNWQLLLTETGGRGGPVLTWYLWFCLPLFRFLMLRWLWHLGLWCYFLWRVQRLELHLVPTHPDYAAGLGYLEVVQAHFAALAAAISAVVAASFAESLSSGAMAFEPLYYQVPMVLLLVGILFIGPLFIFSSKLWACRVAGLRATWAWAPATCKPLTASGFEETTPLGNRRWGLPICSHWPI